MNIRSLLRSSFAGLTLACLTACSTTAGPATTILTNGKIFTASKTFQWCDTLVIRGDRVASCTRGVTPTAVAGARIVDLGGRIVIPGINDAHFHGGGLPRHRTVQFESLDPSFDELVAAIRKEAAQLQPGEWLFATAGPAAVLDGRASRDTFDELLPNNPFQLGTFAGHVLVLNSKAMEILGITNDVADPIGGRFIRGPHGFLTGIAEQYADYLVARRLAEITPFDEHHRAYDEQSNEALRFGITSIQDISIGLPASDAARAVRELKTPVRWRVVRFPMPDSTSMHFDEGRAHDASENRVSVEGVKWILDGTPVERGAAMTEPYADGEPFNGVLNFTGEQVRGMLEEARASGDQPLFHAVGDRAIEQVLDAVDSTGGGAWRSARVRIEHGDFILPRQLDRLRDDGIVVVQNGSHLAIPEMMQARFDAGTLAVAQPLKSLLDRGIPLAFGSDGPLNPFLNIMFATVHPNHPSESISREQAVRAYTWGSAFAENRESEKGTLEPGRLADLAVLSQDIFTVAPGELPKTTSVLTMIGGEVVYDARVLKISK